MLFRLFLPSHGVYYFAVQKAGIRSVSHMLESAIIKDSQPFVYSHTEGLYYCPFDQLSHSLLIIIKLSCLTSP